MSVREGFSVQNWLKGHSINISFIGLANLTSTKDMFALFYDATGTLGFQGIIQKENSNEVPHSSIPKGEVCIG